MRESKRKMEDRLARYRAKRSAETTSEPYGSDDRSRPRLFVVQKHAARRLHFDLRLEWGGTLLSWAVPRGPSMNPEVKRLAVHVEDHPVDYADFEGLIPRGNYGAGTVIVWDRGVWIPIDDPDEAFEKGVLHFELRGYKLRGKWILLRTKGGGDDEWLLIKKPDEWSREDDDFGEESILSGLTIEELRDGGTRAAATRQALEKTRAPRKPVEPGELELMLARVADGPFSSPDWIYELKYDGYRLVAARRADGTSQLRSRNGHDLTAVFPEVALALRKLPYESLVLDGEVVVLDEKGHPSFQMLQQRGRLTRRVEIEHASVHLPATLFVFDLLGFEEFDLRALPLIERKKLLEPLMPRAGPVRYADHVLEHGEAMFAKVGEMGLEGIMAKKASAPYRGGRSSSWLKIVVEKRADLIVVGYTRPKGARAGFGALHLGVYETVGEGDAAISTSRRLVYAGRAGTGFTDEQLESYHGRLAAMEVPEPPFVGPGPEGREHVWVRPEWVVEIAYKEWTRDGLLRAPVFVRRREDKAPEECVRDAGPGEMTDDRGPEALSPSPEAERSGPPPGTVAAASARRPIAFTRPEKVFWPEDGYTKGDLIDYYRTVAPFLLPFLEDRPLVLTRYPDGIHGKSFYQKNAPDFLPDWIETVSVWSGSTEKEVRYIVCNDEETLLFVANLGTIPLHIWPSRVQSIQNPDFCILDLDPKEAPFAHVLTLARAIRKLCDAIELPSFVKTSGSTGLHVLLPLGGQCTFEQSRLLGQLIAKIIESEHPEIATTTRVIEKRQGKVYLDYLQNRHGQLLVSPYCVRPLPGAPVSAPLRWSEVTARLHPQKFTIKNLPARLGRKPDPLASILKVKPDLVGALSRLAERMG